MATRKRHKVGGKKIRAFTSPGGRRFTVGPAETEIHLKSPHGKDAVTYPIYRGKKRVGSISQDEVYAKTADGKMRWHGSLNDLRWQGPLPPTGLGFDVSAHDTLEATLANFARNADQVLNYRAGKMTSSDHASAAPYNGGRSYDPKKFGKPAARRRPRKAR